MSGQHSKTGHLFRDSKSLNRYHSSVSCDNYIYGCSHRFYTNEERLQHKNSCEFDPNVSVICDDCQKVMLRSQEKRHNCIKELRAAINELKQVISGLEEKINEQIIFKDNAQQILEASPQTVSTPEEIGGSYRQFNDLNIDYNKKEIFESEPKNFTEKGLLFIIHKLSQNTSIF